MPIRDYLCNYCGHQFEDVVYYEEGGDNDDWKYSTCRCGSRAEVLPALIGGYTGNTGGASTRPKNSSSMARAKVFTGHPGNDGEPGEQLEFDLKPEDKK